jgi:hypothetical protein
VAVRYGTRQAVARESRSRPRICLSAMLNLDDAQRVEYLVTGVCAVLVQPVQPLDALAKTTGPRACSPGSRALGWSPKLRRTLTSDQGREMARSAALEEFAGIDESVAELHSPWQHPSKKRSTASCAADCHLERPVDRRPGRPRFESNRINTMPRPPPVGDACDCAHRSAVALTG